MSGLLQFTMDLFEGLGSEFARPEPPPKKRVRKAAPPAPPVVTPPPEEVLDAGPSLPAIPLRDTLELARFVHPQATREAVLGSARVAYEFQRGKRKTIGFVVGAEGLSVRAPRWVALRDVDAAVQEKADWILRKLVETQQRHARVEATRIEWQDGAVFPFLGETVAIRLDPKHAFIGVGGALDEAADGTGAPRALRLAVAQNAEPSQIRDAAQAWLMRQARKLFIERLDHFAPRLGVRWQKLTLSNAATRWGSASIDGSIRLNWRLIHFGLPVIDYVVAHELAHLRVMDHSHRFWETVESVVPDYGALRQQLKDQPIPKWN
ncbi:MULTISPECIES: SprT family zinc-dependent metalloprotease [unclassified Variovorax]|uniref:M48 family metallopeptidase n=1 Tax=unclassified Variovorax TaxID=663243 RepID=UPI002576C4A2|nr:MULTISPECIES: SprT family zinc-dependent metalloprotease [unclassified Variovorax]MDM0091708.1 SprT family zinc-dependent metalloprotease [Variovorax sp. J22G40]MDM0149789.1 SprT family zinc-dependent metalloprotease [Variovorax sp. J2P1-31]